MLTLTWNDMAFPCLFVDDALYAVVYEQENDENSDAIAQRQAAVSEAEQAAKDAACGPPQRTGAPPRSWPPPKAPGPIRSPAPTA